MQPQEPKAASEGRVPGLPSRAERKRKGSPKERIANLEEFVGALLPLVLHLADQLEGALGRHFLRDVFPNREKFSAKPPAAPAKETKDAVHSTRTA